MDFFWFYIFEPSGLPGNIYTQYNNHILAFHKLMKYGKSVPKSPLFMVGLRWSYFWSPAKIAIF